MNALTWGLTVVIAASACAIAIAAIPRQDVPESEVQVCGENGIRTETPRGHVACTLKTGKTIFLRSSK